MRQEFQSEETGPYSLRTGAGSAAAGSEEAEAEQAILDAEREDYLDRVCLPLLETLPYAARADLRREVASHLKSLSDAYEEMGDPPPVAARKAREKFGSPEKVARIWQKNVPAAGGSRTRNLSLWVRRQWPGMTATLSACFLVAVLFSPVRPVAVVSNGTLTGTQSLTEGPRDTLAPLSEFRHRVAVESADCSDCHRPDPFPSVEARQQSLEQQTRLWMSNPQRFKQKR